MWWEPLLGAVVGSAATAGATLVISAYLNRQRENREALNALQVVSTELEENQGRIHKLGIPKESPGACIQLDRYSPECLTLGDWEKSKSTLAVIALRDKALWESIRAIYGDIFEAKRSSRFKPAEDQTPEEVERSKRDMAVWLEDIEARLTVLKPQLRKLEQELRDELGLPYFLSSPLRRQLPAASLGDA
jgi:hypothetical protein